MVTSLFAAEHDALRDTVRRWVEREAAPRAVAWEAGEPPGPELLRSVGQQGWFALALPEVQGGDVLAALVVAEELGRIRSGGVVRDLLAQAHAAATLASMAVSPSDEETLSGERAGWLPGGLHATRDDSGWWVSGRVRDAANVRGAYLAAAFVDTPEGLALARVDAGAGLHPAESPAPFGRRGGNAGDVTLEQALVPDDEVITGPRATELIAERQARWRLDTSAAAVSAAWLTWEDTKAYALQREAFGRAIGKFQVNRHALADMAAQLTSARALVHETARRFLTGRLEPGETAALRLYVNRVAAETADRCLQLHGGYGYTMEFDVQRAWRDARHLRVDEAGDDTLREELASAMEERTA